jgi:hypothetical protein
MKMVKTLLLGSAAGLVAVTAGQAADMPVKAKPVEYVKICSLYGAGFYYIPGTDTCLKIGGWVRSEMTWGTNGNSTTGPWDNTDDNNRLTSNFWSRERGYITADARDMTPYGVARGYIAVGISSQNSGNEFNSAQFSANRAFVQWAGFTAGQSVSFFDFYTAAAFLIRAGQTPSEDTGDGGIWIWAYTAQLGSGFSATLSAEDRRTSQIIGLTGAALPVTFVGVLPGAAYAPGVGYGGWQVPDIVGNLRVDETWGSAQIMAAAHEVNPQYYGPGSTDVVDGHPSDQWGWVVGAGIKLNAPFIAQGDYAMAEVNYTQGATGYLWNGTKMGNETAVQGGTVGYGVGSDCVYAGSIGVATNTSCLLTTGWGVNFAYEHYWTPQLHQSFVVSYTEDDYNAQANALLCAAEGGGNATGSFLLGTLAAAPGCNNNWNVWAAGSRLQWDITKEWYVSADVVYMSLQSGTAVGGVLPAAIVGNLGGALACGALCQVSNQSDWLFSVRMHKDFFP